MRKEFFRSKRGLFVLLGLIAMGALVMMPLGCGGGSSGTGSGTVSLSGTVADPTAGDPPVPVGDATVGAYRFDDSTLISSTTSAASGATGSFILTDIPTNVEIYLKAGKTGYVSGNTRTGTLTADDTGADVMIISENPPIPTSPGLLDIANDLAAKNEAAWNSTLQEYGYLIMDAEDTNSDDLGGLTVTATPAMDILYDYDNGTAEAFTSTAPTNVITSRQLPMMGAAVPSSAGSSWAFKGALTPGFLEETAINAPIFPGEFTYFEWYQTTRNVVKLNAVDEDYVNFGSMAGFTYSTDWSVIETVQIPADADTSTGAWHTFRGSAWHNAEGDIAIGFKYGTTPGIQAWYQKSGWTTLSKDFTLARSTWYTVCLQYDHDASTLSLYVDNSTAPATTIVGPADDRTNTNGLYWGGQFDSSGTWGELYTEEDVVFANQAWFQRLLTPAEIDAYSGDVDDTDPTLFFSTQIDTANTTVNDASGNGHDGINGNSPVYYSE